MPPALQANLSSAPVFIACSVQDLLFAEPLHGPAVEAALGREVEHLAADHAAETRGTRQRLHQFDPHRRIGMGLGARRDVEREREQPVTGEDGGRVVERLVHRRLAAAQVVVVHGRQVVMHQRIAMDAFERGARHQGLVAVDPEQRCAFHHQERTEALAGAQAGVAHGLEQAGGPADLPAEQRGAQQPVEQRLAVLGDLVQTVLELCRRVHFILMVKVFPAAFYSSRASITTSPANRPTNGAFGPCMCGRYFTQLRPAQGRSEATFPAL